MSNGRAERFSLRKRITIKQLRNQGLKRRDTLMSNETSEALKELGKNLIKGSDAVGSAGNTIALESAAIEFLIASHVSDMLTEHDFSKFEKAIQNAEKEVNDANIAVREIGCEEVTA